MIDNGDAPRVQIFSGQNEAAEHIKEKHLEMIMNARQAGRDIPAVGVSLSAVGADVARPAVEASQRTMRRATTKSFLIDFIPWHRRAE